MGKCPGRKSQMTELPRSCPFITGYNTGKPRLILLERVLWCILRLYMNTSISITQLTQVYGCFVLRLRNGKFFPGQEKKNVGGGCFSLVPLGRLVGRKRIKNANSVPSERLVRWIGSQSVRTGRWFECYLLFYPQKRSDGTQKIMAGICCLTINTCYRCVSAINKKL
jgi:hypothetical protein